MNRFSIRHLAAAVSLAALLVMVIIAGVNISRGDDTASAQPNQAQPEPSASGTTTVPAPTTAETSDPVPAVTNSLDAQLGRFVEAYFYIGPADTADSRRSRVSELGLVAAEALQQLAFTSSDVEAEYQLLGIIQEARLDPQTVSASAPDGPATAWQVFAPVRLLWTDDVGNPVGDDEIWIGSTWVRNGDTWIMTSFSPEGGG